MNIKNLVQEKGKKRTDPLFVFTVCIGLLALAVLAKLTYITGIRDLFICSLKLQSWWKITMIMVTCQSSNLLYVWGGEMTAGSLCGGRPKIQMHSQATLLGTPHSTREPCIQRPVIVYLPIDSMVSNQPPHSDLWLRTPSRPFSPHNHCRTLGVVSIWDRSL